MSYSCKNLVVGCGNILFKDDGFGPRVIEALNEYFADKEMPEDTKFNNWIFSKAFDFLAND